MVPKCSLPTPGVSAGDPAALAPASGSGIRVVPPPDTGCSLEDLEVRGW